ncbi:MAG TPA: FAD-binding protein, partial [Mycobacteriales bacterium]|nr:FAD-binding protein [Mycobacteriales bacterium]
MSPALEEQLASVVGPQHLLTDASVTATYETDWTGRFGAKARCVVRPADTDAVAAIVAVCAASGVPLCVQGGNTGLVGGSVPVDGAVLMSLTRLTSIDAVDVVSA